MRLPPRSFFQMQEEQPSASDHILGGYGSGAHFAAPEAAPAAAASVPPVAAVLPDDENLANLVLAWYYAGYYTGKYMASAPR